MGLDWHARIPMGRDDSMQYVQKHYAKEISDGVPLDELLKKAPGWNSPCLLVGANRMGELPDFKEQMAAFLAQRKEDAKKEEQMKHPNRQFVEHWDGMSIEKLMLETENKWSCAICPLLRALQGADSSGSPFVGLTVTSCDFRGKIIGSDDEISEDIRIAAYEDRNPVAMQKYANALEAELAVLRERGALEKPAYAEYAKEFRWGKVPTKKEYLLMRHWREENIMEAVRWLRTCAGLGISMVVSY